MIMATMRKTKVEKGFDFKPFSKKQLKLLSWWQEGSPYFDYDMILCDGSIRSGKTISMITSFIMWSITNFSGENFIMAGKSMGSMKRNVLDPLFKIITAQGLKYKYTRSENPNVQIGTNTYYIFGANNESAQDTLQGLTAAGAMIDEAALVPRNFVEQAIGRCSVDGAKIWLNCNPNSPFHYIKTDYIDKAKEKHIYRLRFNLDDNLTLSEKVKDRYKRMFTGVFYRRYIEGEWVQAEGLVYDGFDHSTMVVDQLPHMKKYFYGVDYGTSNATTFVFAGIGVDNKLYIIDEYYHSGHKSGKQKSPQQYAEDLKAFIDRQNVNYEQCFVDPSAEGFIITCYHNSIVRIAQAINDVKSGIGLVQSLISDDRFRIHKRCVVTLKEISSYSWDPRAQQYGEDKPLKVDDHLMDPIRYICNGTRQFWGNMTQQVFSTQKKFL
jgi:PBSX family phage terminase large subunit